MSKPFHVPSDRDNATDTAETGAVTVHGPIQTGSYPDSVDASFLRMILPIECAQTLRRMLPKRICASV